GCHPTAVDVNVAALCPPELLKLLSERLDMRLSFQVVLGIAHQHPDAPHPLALLRARRERPRRRRAAACDQQFPPSDGDCHTPLPWEVRKGNDTTPRGCSLAVQGGRDAGCFDLSLRRPLHSSRRQLLANARHRGLARRLIMVGPGAVLVLRGTAAAFMI